MLLATQLILGDEEIRSFITFDPRLGAGDKLLTRAGVYPRVDGGGDKLLTSGKTSDSRHTQLSSLGTISEPNQLNYKSKFD